MRIGKKIWMCYNQYAALESSVEMEDEWQEKNYRNLQLKIILCSAQ